MVTEDTKSDNFLMDADVFGLGETWLEKDKLILKAIMTAMPTSEMAKE